MSNQPSQHPTDRPIVARHRNNFDVLRLGAAVAVLVAHAFALSGQSEPTLARRRRAGSVGVMVFFGISGYLIARSCRTVSLMPSGTS